MTITHLYLLLLLCCLCGGGQRFVPSTPGLIADQ